VLIFSDVSEGIQKKPRRKEGGVRNVQESLLCACAHTRSLPRDKKERKAYVREGVGGVGGVEVEVESLNWLVDVLSILFIPCTSSPTPLHARCQGSANTGCRRQHTPQSDCHDSSHRNVRVSEELSARCEWYARVCTGKAPSQSPPSADESHRGPKFKSVSKFKISQNYSLGGCIMMSLPLIDLSLLESVMQLF